MSNAAKPVKLTARAAHLLREIAAGRGRLWACDDAPPGWRQLERAGLAVRVACGACNGNDRAELTPAGAALMSGNPARPSQRDLLCGEVLEQLTRIRAELAAAPEALSADSLATILLTLDNLHAFGRRYKKENH